MNVLSTMAIQAVSTALFAGLVAAIVSDVMRRRSTTLDRKRHVLFRIVGYRHQLTSTRSDLSRIDDLLSALNESCLVFARDRQVVSELQRMLSLRDQTEGLLPLIRAMAKAAKVPINVGDDFLIKPFNYRGGRT